MRGALYRFWRNESGAAALEFALVAIPLLMFTFGITEFGRAVFMQQSLSYATDIVARQLYLDPNRSEAAIRSDILSNLLLGEPSQLQVAVSPIAAASGTTAFRTIHLEVQYNFRSVVPAWITDSIPMTFERTITVSD